jgi:surface antigen
MFRQIQNVLVASSAALLLACTTVPSKQDQGVMIGAVAGGILGNQVGGGSGRVLATMAGTDRMNTTAALENVRTGVPSAWVNPDTGYEYVVTPTNTYDGASGPCREYTMNATIGGRTEQVYGTACRQPDGSWQIVS